MTQIIFFPQEIEVTGILTKGLLASVWAPGPWKQNIKNENIFAMDLFMQENTFQMKITI